MPYFADAAFAVGTIIGRILVGVVLYFVIYGLIRLFTKRTPTKNQKIIAGVVAVLLVIASVAGQSGQ